MTYVYFDMKYNLEKNKTRLSYNFESADHNLYLGTIVLDWIENKSNPKLQSKDPYPGELPR